MSDPIARIAELEALLDDARREIGKLRFALSRAATVLAALAVVDDLGPFASVRAIEKHAAAASEALGGKP